MLIKPYKNMKAKDFTELDFSPWDMDFTEDAFDIG